MDPGMNLYFQRRLNSLVFEAVATQKEHRPYHAEASHLRKGPISDRASLPLHIRLFLKIREQEGRDLEAPLYSTNRVNANY